MITEENMSVEQIADKMESLLKKVGCPSAEICIISNDEVGFSRPGYCIGIAASNPIEIDKIQAVMTMTEAKFIKWHKDELGEYMLYFVPLGLSQ